jgi:hypothetical protein
MPASLWAAPPGIRKARRVAMIIPRLLVPLLVSVSLALAGCKPSYGVGDHVLVEWEGNRYPALITEVPSPAKFKIHYDGYDAVWDETVGRDRIKGFVEGVVTAPEPPAKVRAKAFQAAQSNRYKMNDRVRVEWHGQFYPATIKGIVGPEQYRVNYEGYGAEWDESVPLSRIQPRQ